MSKKEPPIPTLITTQVHMNACGYMIDKASVVKKETSSLIIITGPDGTPRQAYVQADKFMREVEKLNSLPGI